jgi:hypothetical protein
MGFTPASLPPVPEGEAEDRVATICEEAEMTPRDYIEAARVPHSVAPQEFGLWTIQRVRISDVIKDPTMRAVTQLEVGFPDYTLLRRVTQATIHVGPGDVVMEDSARELQRHLPIWLRARGRVLVTGLGLGCVVRGLLANRDVDRIEVVEIDRQLARVIGREFAGDARVGIMVGDALEVSEDDLPGRFDFAWHDLWNDRGEKDVHLQQLHLQLFFRFKRRCGPQGAWEFPRFLKRLLTQRSKIEVIA